MIHFDIPKQKSSILKVIGVGGGGGNAVNHMYSQNIESVDFIICNTDAQALANSKVPNKIQLGPHLTQGLGAGANPAIGKQATEESLEEIKRILEVNTKMAFITAGMGGGTGTGGAPIISKICKDLGILTVGIVTTPFSNEGPKRMRHAEEGIQQLRDNVDTLLVISNDKLRHQYGNLKVREAFSKADNILATASKCITDVITSNGQINVDFADVCTVMRNGGVAILGSATAEGEDRAQRAIEDAVNSPLLNDSEIRGAKWILVNITSSEGEHEITMDEEDTIMSYLRQQAGEDTDVIKGIGFDDNLGTKIGVTIIATGFEHKDPFKQHVPVKEEKKEEKIIMTLGVQDEEKKLYTQPMLALEDVDPYAPTISEEPNSSMVNGQWSMDNASLRNESLADDYENKMKLDSETKVDDSMILKMPGDDVPVAKEESKVDAKEDTMVLKMTTDDVPVAKEETNTQHSTIKIQRPTENHQPPTINHQPPTINHQPNNPPPTTNHQPSYQQTIHAAPAAQIKDNFTEPKNDVPAARTSSGFLAKPSNIYAQPEKGEPVSAPKETEPSSPVLSEQPELEMKLVMKDTPETADEAKQPEVRVLPQLSAEDLALQDDADDQKRRAAERIQKLRNLSFNMNAADPNNEFEAVPAYIRRNMEMFGNTLTSVENFYSKYTVNKDENNKTEISSINTFLDGKKPD